MKEARKMAGWLSFSMIWFGVVAATMLAMRLLGSDFWGVDDAYIFFVYAENFASGHGFVYNVGELPVEGFSSMLWQCILTLLSYVGAIADVPLIIITSGLAALSLWCVWDAFSRLIASRELAENTFDSGQVRAASIVFFAWCFALPGWLIWNVAAFMDVALWVAILSLLVRQYALLATSLRVTIHQSQVYAVLILICTFVRPESIAWGLFFIGAFILLLRLNRQNMRPLILYPVASYLAGVLCITAFRLVYFSYPLPNTYYAKVSPSLVNSIGEGAAYIGTFLSGGGFASLATIAAAIVFCLKLPRAAGTLLGTSEFSSREELLAFFLTAFVVVNLMVVLLTGGDHFGSWRMLLPAYTVLPLFILTWLLTQPRLASWTERAGVRRLHAPLLFLGCVIVLTAPVRGAWYAVNRTGLLVEFQVAEEGVATARLLQEVLSSSGAKELPSVGVTAAGGFKYAWEGSVFDLMGLNHIEMAHSPGDRTGVKGHAAFDKDIFFRHLPDLVLPHTIGWSKAFRECGQLTDPQSFQSRVLKGLLQSYEFHQAYRYFEQGVAGRKLCGFVKKGNSFSWVPSAHSPDS